MTDDPGDRVPDASHRLIELDAPARLAAGDSSLFTRDPGMAGRRLGWVDLAARAHNVLPGIAAAADDVRSAGFTDALLLGMGGSSLAARVLTEASTGDGLRIHVLDTSSPDTLAATLDAIDPLTTLVIVASKSGTTVEPLALTEVIHTRLSETLGPAEAWRHFIAVTDPATPLSDRARAERWRRIVFSPPNVGGRFSALTVFGLLPAALASIDLQPLLARAVAMESACAVSSAENPAVALAATIAEAVESGHDELVLRIEPERTSFGLWLEQLVAESLGKDGRGPVPVLGGGAAIGPRTTEVTVRVEHADELAAAFVLWERATALAAIALDTEPFDQPAVAEAKEITTAMLAGHTAPSTAADTGEVASVLSKLTARDHLWLLAYLPETPEMRDSLDGAATALSRALGISVCASFGPRYLHSTGQLHKDGPDTGCYLVITAPCATDFDVAGQPWSLAGLYRAQADGDVVALERRGRRVLGVELAAATPEALYRCCGSVGDALAAG